MNGKKKEDAEFRLILKDGREFWEGMEVEWIRENGTTVMCTVISLRPDAGFKGEWLGFKDIMSHSNQVRIPLPPKMVPMTAREVWELVNVKVVEWKLETSKKSSFGGMITCKDGGGLILDVYPIHACRYLSDSGEWVKFEKEVEG
jgi:hypothetical protein